MGRTVPAGPTAPWRNLITPVAYAVGRTLFPQYEVGPTYQPMSNMDDMIDYQRSQAYSQAINYARAKLEQKLFPPKRTIPTSYTHMPPYYGNPYKTHYAAADLIARRHQNLRNKIKARNILLARYLQRRGRYHRRARAARSLTAKRKRIDVRKNVKI